MENNDIEAKQEAFIKLQKELVSKRKEAHKTLGALYEAINENQHKILMEKKVVIKRKDDDIPEFINPLNSYNEDELISEVDKDLEKKIKEEMLLIMIAINKMRLQKIFYKK